MMLPPGLELGGVQAVALSDEFAGADGGSQSLADTTSHATHRVHRQRQSAPASAANGHRYRSAGGCGGWPAVTPGTWGAMGPWRLNFRPSWRTDQLGFSKS